MPLLIFISFFLIYLFVLFSQKDYYKITNLDCYFGKIENSLHLKFEHSKHKKDTESAMLSKYTFWTLLSLLLLFFFLFNCHPITTNKIPREDLSEEGTKNLFNPPSWIQGSWSNEGNSLTLKFTEDNIEQVRINGETSLSYKDFYASYGVSETINDNQYRLDVTKPADSAIAQDALIIFNKTENDSVIEYVDVTGSNPPVTTLLTKLN